MTLFGLPDEKVRVIQTETGGGFGGKEEYPSMIAGHAALLAWKSGKPVKMIYDRAEDMVATTKRHPSRTRHRTAVSSDGKLLAHGHRLRDRWRRLRHAFGRGALARHDSCRGTVRLPERPDPQPSRRDQRAAARRLPRLRRAAEHLRAGAAHGQSRRARWVLTPEEFRRRNFLTTGPDHGDRAGDPRRRRYRRRCSTARFEAQRLPRKDGSDSRARIATAPSRRGIGFASFMHGAGFTGSGERYLASVVGMEATRDGRVRILASSTEIGQGTNTILSQIAAERWASPTTRSRLRSPTRRTFRTADRRWHRAPAWWWASWWNRPRSDLKQTLAANGLLTRAIRRQLAARHIALHRPAALRSASTRRRPASSGTMKTIRATRTARLRGPSMWPKSASTR